MVTLQSRDDHRLQPAIQVQNLCVHYDSADSADGLTAVDNVSLDIRPGEFFTLIGPSGSGKSTILNAIAGLVSPSSGQVLVNGNPITGPSPKTIAVVFQDYTLMPWRNVVSNVEFGLELQGVPAGERRRRALHYLEMVGLAGFARSYPGELSGGMQQRVALARALALETEILLLDEPFGALDEQTRMDLGTELEAILGKTNKTIVFVTHSLDEAVFLSDRIAVLSARPGRLKGIIEVPRPHPREDSFRMEPLFNELRGQLYAMIRSEARRQMQGSERDTGYAKAAR